MRWCRLKWARYLSENTPSFCTREIPVFHRILNYGMTFHAVLQNSSVAPCVVSMPMPMSADVGPSLKHCFIERRGSAPAAVLRGGDGRHVIIPLRWATFPIRSGLPGRVPRGRGAQGDSRGCRLDSHGASAARARGSWIVGRGQSMFNWYPCRVLRNAINADWPRSNRTAGRVAALWRATDGRDRSPSSATLRIHM